MKRIFIIYLFLLFNIIAFGQSTVVGHGWAGGRHLGFDASNGINPLPFTTNNILRMSMNGNVSPNINTQGAAVRNGYVGIGQSYAPSTDWNSITGGPMSLLHLNGDEGTFAQILGYRNWMKNGISFTNNNDLGFIGNRKLSTKINEFDISEMTLSWSDNAGVDDFCIRFTSGSGTTVSNNFEDQADLDGLHIARFTGRGFMGLGSTFGTNAFGMTPTPAYVSPQSLLHMSLNGNRDVWSQFTNQNVGESATDGFRVGLSRGDAFLFNQENANMIFSTNESTGNLTRERMRLTHIGAAGVPATSPNNTTRLGISYNPAVPLTQPRSLVHIGENVDQAGLGITDGARNWMDVGYLASFGSDNIYVGLKREENEDRYDAVIAWGDNQTNLINSSGPDNLRFIFANSQLALSPGTNEAKSNDGQEIGRFTPACDGCPVNTGSLGIGNFSPGSPNAPTTTNYVGATLDVDGDARIRTVTQNDNLTQVLVRDPSDLGRIHWRDASTFTGGAGGSIGNDCNLTQNPLTSNWEIPLGNNNFHFTGQSLPSAGNTVNIGINCGTFGPAKFNLVQNTGTPINVSTTGGFYSNQDISSVIGPITYTGLYAEAIGLQEQPRIDNVGGTFYAANAANNYGVRGNAFVPNNPPANTGLNGFGGYFTSTGPGNGNNGVIAEAYGGTFQNTGVSGMASSFVGDPTTFNRGGIFSAQGDAETNTGVHAIGIFPGNLTSLSKAFGVFATVGHTVPLYTPLPSNVAIAVYGGVVNPFPSGVPTFAGYFDGDVFINGPTNGTGYALVSDAQFKTNVQDIQNASQIVNQLQPKSYDFIDGSSLGMNFSDEHQYGFIAQEVEAILPELVNEVTKPATVDSLGNVVTPQVDYKSLNYIGFIALLMQDAKEKNQKLQQQEQINNQLMQQLAELSARVDNCCNAPSGMVMQNNSSQQAGAVIQTRLENKEEPSLGQNIPNPFEGATRIPAYIPQVTAKAEIIFYGNDGKVLQILSINDRGNVSVDVDAATLAAGVYSYTLFVDGKPVDTKRMVKR